MDEGEGVSVPGDACDVPHWRTNELRILLDASAGAADAAVSNLGAVGQNPLATAIGILNQAWIAGGSTARADFVADVAGVGEGVRRAFTNASDDLRDAMRAEPARIDVNAHPEQEWKTWPHQIQARASMRYPGYP